MYPWSSSFTEVQTLVDDVFLQHGHNPAENVSSSEAYKVFGGEVPKLTGIRREAVTITSATSIQAFPNHLSGPLRMEKKYKEILQEHTVRLLQDAAQQLGPTIRTKFTDIISAMAHIVGTTATFRESIAGALEARQFTFSAFAQELQAIFMVIMNDLEKKLPLDKAPGHVERAKMVDKVLDIAKLALTDLAARHGIDGDVVATYLSALKPHVHALVLAVGDVNEQYPQFLPFLEHTAAVLLVPESWILLPLLRLFGFAHAGPVKGSVAARLQKHLWGAAVESGSWFSFLQAAGMKVAAKHVDTVVQAPSRIGRPRAKL